MFDVVQIVVVIVALAGGLVSAILGWLDSGEAFIMRKFISSVLASLLAALVFVVAYLNADTFAIKDFIIIFLGAAGVDVLVNRGVGAIAAKAAPTVAETKP